VRRDDVCAFPSTPDFRLHPSSCFATRMQRQMACAMRVRCCREKMRCSAGDAPPCAAARYFSRRAAASHYFMPMHITISRRDAIRLRAQEYASVIAAAMLCMKELTVFFSCRLCLCHHLHHLLFFAYDFHHAICCHLRFWLILVISYHYYFL